MGTVRDAMLDALAVLMPVECVGCGAPDRSVCSACRAMLAADLRQHALADGTPVLSALDYSGVARAAILAFKEQGRTDATRALSAPLRQALCAALESCGTPATELVCVPTSRSSYRRRGYDPVRLLVRRAGFRTSGLLRHSRRTEHQKALDRESRGENVVGSLAARVQLTGREVIVVDDVMTTGATLTEAVRAIREAGGRVALAVTLAHTARRFNTHRTN